MLLTRKTFSVCREKKKVETTIFGFEVFLMSNKNRLIQFFDTVKSVNKNSFFLAELKSTEIVDRGRKNLVLFLSIRPKRFRWEISFVLVMRSEKSFRLVLNSKIFSQMKIERLDGRSFRFAGQDDGTLRIFVFKVKSKRKNDQEKFRSVFSFARRKEFVKRFRSFLRSTSKSNRTVCRRKTSWQN